MMFLLAGHFAGLLSKNFVKQRLHENFRIPAPWLTKEIIFVCTVFLSFTLCVQRSWTTLAGVSPVTVIASEPCS